MSLDNSQNQSPGKTDSALMYDAVLEDFINQTGKKDTSYKCNLFRKIERKGASGRQKHEFLKAYEDYIPGFEDIGEDFGSGDYRLNVSFTKKDGQRGYKTQEVTISERFNKKPEALEQPAAEISGAAISPDAAYMQLLANQNNMMFQTMLSMMDKVLTAGATRPQESPNVEKLQSSINQILISSAKQQQELIANMAKRSLAEISPDLDDDQDNGEGGTEIFELLKMLWDNFGQKILKGNKAFQSLAKKQIQGNDQLKAILANPEAYAEAYDQLIEEAPPNQVNKLLKILEVPTPDELLNTVPYQQQANE